LAILRIFLFARSLPVSNGFDSGSRTVPMALSAMRGIEWQRAFSGGRDLMNRKGFFSYCFLLPALSLTCSVIFRSLLIWVPVCSPSRPGPMNGLHSVRTKNAFFCSVGFARGVLTTKHNTNPHPQTPTLTPTPPPPQTHTTQPTTTTPTLRGGLESHFFFLSF